MSAFARDAVRINVEYLWLDAKHHTRTKVRTLYLRPEDVSGVSLEDLSQVLGLIPRWSYDGGSTGQATVEDSECVLKPVHVIRHPFPLRPASVPSFLVMCEVRTAAGRIHPTDTRATVRSAYEDSRVIRSQRAWFGVEQEFFFFDKATKAPHGWAIKCNLPRDEYYCGVNRSFRVERDIMAELYEKCLECDIPISGINQEVSPSQWEYQIGPAEAPYIGDYMYFAKYILFRLCERHDLYPAFNPKPIKGDWNGSGCHFNISTCHTRRGAGGAERRRLPSDAGGPVDEAAEPAPERRFGLERIEDITDKMSDNHEEFMRYTGSKNDERLTGSHETCHYGRFSVGIGARNTSVRIPRETTAAGCGYFEDRRPGANVDYYTMLGMYARYLV